jgi:hypothetical protein
MKAQRAMSRRMQIDGFLRVIALCVAVAGGGVARECLAEPLPPTMTLEAKGAIDKGLQWLSRAQGRDGAWRNQGQYGQYPVAMTSLATLALLMDGNTTTQGRYAPQVDRATRYLLGSTTANGMIARGTGDSRPMYGHGFSMLVLGQLYGMTESVERQREIELLLNRGIDLTARAQSRLGGWIYQPNSGGDEGSVTITQLQALRSCRNAGLTVPKQVIDESMKYLEISMNSDGGMAYRANHPGPSRPAITAAAVCCWFNAGQYDNPLAKRALEFALDRIPNDTSRYGHWFYGHLYLAQAVYLSGPEKWEDYFPPLRDLLVGAQSADGSWDDPGVGDVYGTSVALIILQLPFNQLPIMQR